MSTQSELTILGYLNVMFIKKNSRKTLRLIPTSKSVLFIFKKFLHKNFIRIEDYVKYIIQLEVQKISNISHGMKTFSLS